MNSGSTKWLKAWRASSPWARRVVPWLACVSMLASCESYRSLPLADAPEFVDSVKGLRAQALRDWPALQGRVPSLDEPLDADSLAIIAVENNPELKAVRTRHGVARAQVLQAGLLPDPQLNGSVSFVTSGPGTVTGYTVGLGEDLRSLVLLRPLRRTAREAVAAAVDAEILWVEWLVVEKSRQLYVHAVAVHRLRSLLDQTRTLLASRAAHSREAAAAGNLSAAEAAIHANALADVDRQISEMSGQSDAVMRQIDRLLGLRPGTPVPLRRDLSPVPIDPAQVESLIATLPHRRPDLIALQQGYRAQEAAVRAAILAQFPSLVLSIAGGRDTSGVGSIGPGVTVDLPVFNRNRGAIAVERATRRRLHEEYAARLAATVAEVRHALAEEARLEARLSMARAYADRVDALVQAGIPALKRGLIDERVYVDLATGLLQRRQEVVAAEQALLDQQIALVTLLGAGMPEIQSGEWNGKEDGS